MKRLEAPTSRMMPVSLERFIADSRMVVVMSRTAARAIMAARPPVTHEARFITRKSGSRVARWSTTRSTPARPVNCSATASYCVGSTSLMRKEIGIMSSVAMRPRA